MSINQTVISGNLTRNPELKQTKKGIDFLTFTVAFNDQVRDGDTFKQYPNFIDVTYYGTSAKNIYPYLRKAQHVCVSGKLRYSEWENPDGSKRNKIELIASEIDFQGSAKVED